MSRLSPVHDLVDVAKQINDSSELVGAVTMRRLEVVAEQMRALRAQAESIVQEAERDLRLHQASCAFKRRPGRVYHLYVKDSGETYLSMLSPADWGEPPHTHEGSYRLEADLSWTPVSDIPERDARAAAIRAQLPSVAK